MVDEICQEGVQTKSLDSVKKELEDQKPNQIIYKRGYSPSGKNHVILDKYTHTKFKEYIKNLLKKIYSNNKIDTKELESYCKLLKITVPKSRLSNFLLTDSDCVDLDLLLELSNTLGIYIRKRIKK